MRIIKRTAPFMFLATLAFACAAPTTDDGGDGDGDGDNVVGDGDAVPGTGGSGVPGAGGSTSPGAGGSTSPGAGGSTSPGAGGSASTTCTALTAGTYDEAGDWWAGSSNGSGTVGSDNKSISGAAIAGKDQWDGPTGWANISYAFSATCADASALTSISVDVTANVAGDYRIALKTNATAASANHFQKTETFAQGETKTVVLMLDGSNLASSWQPPEGTFDAAHLQQVVAMPLLTDEAGLAAYDYSMANVVVQ